ncbi:hypothetical protein C0991_008854 [Blastosporella zonata]|nr:hypothetical protein C0991_008854 [Blastosporella zonata]
MGGAASKATRKLPTRAEAPSWAGARTPHPSQPPPERPPRDRRASESRTQEIERDARDPDFLANLSRLGPVRVDHHMQTIPTVSGLLASFHTVPLKIAQSTAVTARETTQLFKSRSESEHEASSTSPVHNRLHAASLTDLLDKRKSAKSIQDVERLAKQYGIDAAKLESLARFVSSPSVQSGSEIRTVEKEGGEESVMIRVSQTQELLNLWLISQPVTQAIWMDPQLQK